jgi:hypothetical protein
VTKADGRRVLEVRFRRLSEENDAAH